MVSAGVCFCGKGRLHFIPDTAKVNAKLYVETVVGTCSRLQICFAIWLHLSTVHGARMAKLVQDWIATDYSSSINVRLTESSLQVLH